MKSWAKVLISAAVTLACLVLVLFSRIVILPVIALAAFMGVYWGIGYMIPPVIALTAGSLVFTASDPGAFCSAGMFMLLPIILAVYGKKRLPHRYALLALAAVICLGTYLSAALAPMLKGEPPYSALAEAWDNAIVSSFTSVFSEELAGYSETLEFLNSFSEMLPNFMMVSVLLIAEFSAAALIFSFKLWHRVFRIPPAPMAKFHNWRLPSSSIIGAVILILGIILVYVFKVEQATAIALTLGFIVLSMFSVQGLAYLMFILRLAKAPKIMRVLLWVIAALLFPSSLLLLSVIGFGEQIQHKRRRVLDYIRQESERSRLEQRADEYAKYGYIRDEKDKDSEDKPDEGEKKE